MSRAASILGYPTLFPLAPTTKFTSKQREDSLRRRLQRVKDSHKHDFANVEIDNSYGSPVLQAGPIVLVTVLEVDLPDYYTPQMPASVRQSLELQVARRWASVLQEDLDIAATMNTPSYHRFAIALALLLLLFAAAAHRGLSYLGRHRFNKPLWVFKCLVWTFCGGLSLSLFSEYQSLGRWIEQRLLTPSLVLLLVLACGLTITLLADGLVRAYLRAILDYQGKTQDPRLRLRLDTYAGAGGWVIRVLVGLGCALFLLRALGFQSLTSLASIGAVGVGLGYLAQDTIKNATAGLMVLAEDRYSLGDWLESARFAGEVESFDLFTTRLRDLEGSLITVSNGQFEIFKNCSKLWSQVDFKVQVAYSSDLDRALEILMEEARKVAQEDPACVPDSLKLLGVQDLGDSAITLRLLLRTAPAQHWSVSRKLNLQVKNRFDKEGIEMPFPQLSVWSRQENSVETPDAAEPRPSAG